MGNYRSSDAGDVPYGMMQGYAAPNADGASYGMMGGRMMGSYPLGGLSDIRPLSADDAKTSIETYVAALGNSDLELKEVLVFDNQAYGLIVEKSTGIGAMEVLVDPVSKAVYPEPGPNMMWNQKYSPMSGMMGGWRNSSDATSAMPVTEKEAVEVAQKYLETYLPGTNVEDHADIFYGYYTLEVLRDGEIAGMLSVNGYSDQVFLHTWHGKFIEISEADQQ